MSAPARGALPAPNASASVSIISRAVRCVFCQARLGPAVSPLSLPPGRSDKRRAPRIMPHIQSCEVGATPCAGAGVQVVNTSTNRLHCQSAPSAALVDVRLVDSNAAATQANIRTPRSAPLPCGSLGGKSWPWLLFMLARIRSRLRSHYDRIHILTHIFARA